MQLIKERVKGSSLIEVVVGLFIISLSIALAGTLFAQVFDSSKRIITQKAWYDVNMWRSQVYLTNSIESEEKAKKVYRLIKHCELQNENKGLWLVNIKAVKESSGLETLDNDELVSVRFYIEIEPED